MTLIDKAEALRRIVLTGEQMAGASSSDVVDAIHRDVAALAATDASQAPFRMEDMTLADLMRDPLYEAATIPATDAAQARPAWLSNCMICGRIVDTREKAEGGDGHGCEYAEGWTCSSDCAEKLHPDPDWMKEGLAAQVREAALIEAAKTLHDWQDDLIASQMPETAVTVGMAADVVLALLTKESRT